MFIDFRETGKERVGGEGEGKRDRDRQTDGQTDVSVRSTDPLPTHLLHVPDRG